MAHEEGNAGRVWEEVEGVWKSNDGITVRRRTGRAGWYAERGLDEALGEFITPEEAMSEVDERWPWKPDPAPVEGRVWKEVDGHIHGERRSSDGIRVFPASLTAGGPWCARGAGSAGALIEGLGTPQEAMDTADERWPWVLGFDGRVWEEVRDGVWQSNDGIRVAIGLGCGWCASYTSRLEGFTTAKVAMDAADERWPFERTDPVVAIVRVRRGLGEIEALVSRQTVVRAQLRTLRRKGAKGLPIDLSPDECAHLDRSWTARLEALDAEIGKRTEKLMSTPPREWGEGR